MNAVRYRVTDAHDLPAPVVTRMGVRPVPIDLRGPNLADVADALLEDCTGRRWPIATVLTLAVMLFGTALRTTIDDEIPADCIDRFADAAGRVAV